MTDGWTIGKERQARGVERLRFMLGPEGAARIEKLAESGAFGSSLVQMLFDTCFAGLWDRPGLDPKLRSVATIALMIALNRPAELRAHMKIGLQNGISVEELEELMMHCVGYCGIACAPDVLSAGISVQQVGSSTEVQSP